MLFSSYSFCFWFLPVTLLFYFLPLALPLSTTWRLRLQNAWLLAASLFFYAWGEPLYLFLMLGTVLFDFLVGLHLAHSHRPRAWLLLALLLHLGTLFYFKYAPPLAEWVGISLPQAHLPLGISFYTFQALSYLVDVYRGTVPPEKSVARLGLYVSLFPQLIAGPIVRYTDVADALGGRTYSVTTIAQGIRRFACGLAKKLFLANPAGELFLLLMGREAPLSALGALAVLLAFALQIYFDFSGYSDMAIGLGKVLGFPFPENFNYPYVARSITDFWRRWHITLSSFFREYVYFPLGGSRQGRWRTLGNLLVVWTLTGLWHGAALNFLFWGLYYFLLLALEKFVFRPVLPHIPHWAAHTLTLSLILFGWLIFALDGSSPALSLGALPRLLGSLLGRHGLLARGELYELRRHLPLLLIGAIGSTPLPRRIYCQTVSKTAGAWLSFLLPIGALLLCVAQLADAGFNPFLYFRF